MAGDFFWNIYCVLVKLSLGKQKKRTACTIKYQVPLNALKLMGITVENSEDYQSPYCRASFYPREDAAIGSYYAQFWDEELQQRKLIINQNELNENDLQNEA